MGDFPFDQNNYMQCSTVFTNLKHPFLSPSNNVRVDQCSEVRLSLAGEMLVGRVV